MGQAVTMSLDGGLVSCSLLQKFEESGKRSDSCWRLCTDNTNPCPFRRGSKASMLQIMAYSLSVDQFIAILRLILTSVYTVAEAELIVSAVNGAIKADDVSAERALRNCSDDASIAVAVVGLAKEGGSMLGSDQLQLAIIVGARRLSQIGQAD